jgi:hypothetical protein
MISVAASVDKYLMVFRSNNHAMLVYNELVKTGCRVNLVSTPCKLSSGCSKSLVFNSTDTEKVIAAVKKNNALIGRIYKIVINQGRRDYVPI